MAQIRHVCMNTNRGGVYLNFRIFVIIRKQWGGGFHHKQLIEI
jgi:hypothetical protein